MPPTALLQQRILVTGAAGFIGQHLCRRLELLGAEVLGTRVNILDRVKLLALMREHDITACVHLAGLTTVESGYENPAPTLETNIQGTVNVLECARAVGLERVIIASSVHAYGPQPTTPYLETFPLLPTRPYETSKACADMIAQSYALTFNLPVLIPRFVNTYGPGDMHTQRLIPKTIRSLLQGHPPLLWGGGSIQRDYLFIDDAIEAYMKLLQVDMTSVGQNRAINIGTGHLASVREVMEIIARCMQTPLQVTAASAERQSEIISQQVSIAKADTVLAWTPTVDLKEGLRRTVNWYVHHDKVRAKALAKI